MDYKLISFWIVTFVTICIFFIINYFKNKEPEYSEYLAFSISITYYILQLAAISDNKYFISVLAASLSLFILAIIRIGKSSNKLFKALVMSIVLILVSTALLIYVDPKHIREFLISLFLSIIFAILGLGFEKRNLPK